MSRQNARDSWSFQSAYRLIWLCLSVLLNCPMSLQDVAVSVVGKYRYTMMSPAEHDRVPIIVDIILVGRTKIITLHSSLWLENHTDRPVSFRLHVPLTPLTAPTHPANSSQDPTGNIIIGPFPPGSGECSTLRIPFCCPSSFVTEFELTGHLWHSCFQSKMSKSCCPSFPIMQEAFHIAFCTHA